MALHLYPRLSYADGRIACYAGAGGFQIYLNEINTENPGLILIDAEAPYSFPMPNAAGD